MQLLIGAGSDTALISQLELDFDSAFARNANNSPQKIQSDIAGSSRIAGIVGSDGPTIAASIYSKIASAGYFLSSLQGAAVLSQTIIADYTNNAVLYATILSNIQTSVRNLSGGFTNNDIANNIATAIGAGNDTNLISKLELDFDSASRYGASPQSIQSDIGQISGSDGPSIAASIYGKIASAGSFLSLLQSAVALSNYITADYNAGVPYATILSNIHNTVTALPSGFTNNDLATAVATAIGASNDLDLIAKLELDFDLSTPQNIQSVITNIFAIDGPSIAIKLYNAFNYPNFSSLQGAVALCNNIAADNTAGVPYTTILSNIQLAVANLSITNNKIANAIAVAVDASSDTALITALEVDLDASPNSATHIQSNIASATGTDGPSIAVSIYNMIGFSWVSMIPASIALSNDITIYNNNNTGPTYATILTNIQNAVAPLTGTNLTNDNIVLAIAGAVNASHDTGLINSLETISDVFLSPSAFQSAITGISITNPDGPLISASICNLFGAVAYAEGNGAITLAADITLDYNNGTGPAYAQIVTNIQNAVAALTGSFTNNNIAVAIAGAINASNDSNLITQLTLDFDTENAWIGQTPANIQTNIASLIGTDGPSISNSLYNNVFQTWGFLSANQGAIALSNDILANYNNGAGPSYAQIVTNIKNTIAALTGSFTNNDIATAIAGAVGGSSDNVLISSLEIYFDGLVDAYSITPANIQSNLINNISGDNEYDISSSIYNNANGPYDVSVAPSSLSTIALSNDITQYHGFYEVTMTSAVGNNPIGPKAVTYLNKCTANGGDSYTVGGSVFSGFDPGATGPLLSSMTGLNTITGQMAAIAQCSTWILNNYAVANLYATTSQPAGITDTAANTGCPSTSLAPEIAMILCHSVFDTMAG